MPTVLEWGGVGGSGGSRGNKINRKGSFLSEGMSCWTTKGFSIVCPFFCKPNCWVELSKKKD